MATSQFFKVFVYGTLKRGQPNYHLLESLENGVAKFISEGQTSVKFPLVIGTRYNIPFLLNRPGEGNQIKGEIFSVDEKMMARLDVLEDYPEFYDRQLHEIETTAGDKESCWVYIIKSFPEKLLRLPLLSDYRDTPEKPYQESYEESCTIEQFLADTS